MRSRLALLAAFSDVHSPRFLQMLRNALSEWNTDEPCAVLMAGDIVDRGNVAMMGPVVREVSGKWPGARLIAVFGNEEYYQVREELRGSYPQVRWLDDELEIVECGEISVGVVGTSGALERPTSWQRRHMPWLEKVYRERPARIEALIKEARGVADAVVLLSHYALARSTIIGEDPRIHPYLYSRDMERVLKRARPDVAVHGHAHKGTHFSLVDGVPVYNVALPLNRKVVEIRLSSARKPGLLKWL